MAQPNVAISVSFHERMGFPNLRYGIGAAVDVELSREHDPINVLNGSKTSDSTCVTALRKGKCAKRLPKPWRTNVTMYRRF